MTIINTYEPDSSAPNFIKIHTNGIKDTQTNTKPIIVRYLRYFKFHFLQYIAHPD